MNEEKRKEFVTEWMGRIKAGIDYRQKYSTYDKWANFRKMYRNQWDPGVEPVNKIFSYGRTLVPRVYFKAPRVTVTASRPDLVIHAKVVEAIDNMIIREVMLKETLKSSILDSFLCGVGPIKLGYDSEFGYLPEQAIGEDGDTVTQVSSEGDADKIEYHETIKPGMPWALRVRPEDVVVPWGSVDAQSLPWIAHYILRPLDDIKQDQKYQHTKELKGTRTPSVDINKSPAFRPTNEKDKDITFAELWEIRDLKTGYIYVICEDELILSAKDVLQADGLPYEFVSFNPDPEFFWSIPDADILSSSQRELNDINTQTSKHRAITLLKFLYDQNKVSETELLKALSGQVGAAVGIKDADNLANAIITLQPHIPPDLYQAAMSCMSNMKESLGFSSNELGDYQQGSPRTATETMTVSQSFEQRITERRDIVADVLTRIIRKWNQYLFNFWSSERAVQVVGPDGVNGWVKYTGEQLRGEYFISIDADSGMPLNRGTKMQMAMELMGKFGGDPMVDQIALRQIVLDNYVIMDPRIGQLLAAPPMLDPALAGAVRQPMPAGAGQGSAGGRTGSSPDKPEEFESFKNRHAMGAAGEAK